MLREERIGAFAERITPSPSMEHLDAFMSIFERGSVSAAARHVHLAQSTVSRQLEHLEQLFSCRLFVRSPNGVKPTESAEILYAYARRAAADLSEAAARIAGRQAEPNLSAASVAGPLYTILPDVLAGLSRQHPEIQIRLTEATSDEICAGVRNRRFDVGLVTLPVGEGFLIDVLADDELVLAVPADHPLATRRQVRLRDAHDIPFVLLTQDQMLYRSVVASCQSVGFSPKVACFARSVHLCCHLVARGLGVSVVPRSSTRYRLSPAPRYLPLRPAQRRTLAAIRLAPSHESALLVAALQAASGSCA